MSRVWVSGQAAVDVAMVQESRLRAGAAAEAAALVELLESRLGILAERPQAGAPVPEGLSFAGLLVGGSLIAIFAIERAVLGDPPAEHG